MPLNQLPTTTSGIYIIKNSINEKVYVGSAICLSKRWTVHKSYLNSNNHHSKRLQRAWNKYGQENFEFIPIQFCGKEDLIKYEQYWINHFNSYLAGYNGTPIAGSRLGSTHDEATREKISINRRGKGTGANNCNYGKNLTGHTNNMYGKSVLDIWIERYGPEKANEMWLAKSELLSKKLKGKKGSKGRLGKKNSEYQKAQLSKAISARLINSQGEEYIGIANAAKAYGMSRSSLQAMLTGQNPNKTDLKYKNK